MNLPEDQEERLRRWLAKPEVEWEAEVQGMVDSVFTPANLEKLGEQMWAAMEPEITRLFEGLAERGDAQEARIARLEGMVSRLGKWVLEE